MKKIFNKIFLAVFIMTSLLWLGVMTLRNIKTGALLKFGTIEMKDDISQNNEKETYRRLAEYSVITLAVYPLLIASAVGFLKTSDLSMKDHGWLLMSSLLLLIFVPVETYCMYLDWKLIGLQYWGDWPLEEFRKAFLSRVTALAGLPLIATLCYYTIIGLIIFQPMKVQLKETM